MKILCVLLPHFPLRCEVGRNPALSGRPVIITRAKGSQKLVLDHAPGLTGLQPGLTLQQALARHGEAELVQADLPCYRAVWDGILGALELKSPLVEGAAPGCAYLGLDGMQLIYPDDGAAISAAKEAVPEAFAPQMGIAENKFLACLAARQSPAGGYKILTGDVSSFLKDLLAAVLPVSPESRDKLRPRLSRKLVHSKDIAGLGDGAPVTTAGLVIRRQRPRGKVVFITLEDEFGHVPCMVFPKVYEKYEHLFKAPFLIVKGRLNRREGTHNVVINRVKPLNGLDKAPASKDWS